MEDTHIIVIHSVSSMCTSVPVEEERSTVLKAFLRKRGKRVLYVTFKGKFCDSVTFD